MKKLISTTDVYVVNTVPEVEQLHEELKNDNNFTLAAFSYKTKFLKVKGEEPEEYQLVSAKKVFNDEKNPTADVTITYEVQNAQF